MTNNSTTNNQQLLHDLSALEQQNIIGGQDFAVIGNVDFFLQKTDIETNADNQLTMGANESNSQNTKYNLSQITMGFSFTFGLPKNNFNPHSHQVLNFLPNFLKRLFLYN
ncbi:hypothetical protein WJM97_01330 [Okeanomitos corallinicola TIOX110]|uniref:Uncharacterized protein n=1 Tax=Okeanomitos corallinicola TIOX110 TaxID=3133117 RepID=A0ABZ2USJ6_9CYAN